MLDDRVVPIETHAAMQAGSVTLTLVVGATDPAKIV